MSSRLYLLKSVNSYHHFIILFSPFLIFCRRLHLTSDLNLRWCGRIMSFYIFLSGACSYYLYQRNGRFTSPGFPYRYSNNQHCTWSIEAPYGYYINLQFGSFKLESGYDWVEIFDGSSAYSTRIKRESGYQPSWGVCSSGRFLFVKFTTDSSATYSGFSATYQAVSHGKNMLQLRISL